METATMSKVLGRFLLALFAGLVPATRPLHAPADRVKADLPTGEYRQTTNAPNAGVGGDRLTIARAPDGGYRVTAVPGNEAPVEFAAELFALGKDRGGAPAYFLDLRPLGARPEAHGLPAGATHLAARVRWTVERGQAWLSFDAMDEGWLADQGDAATMTTKELRALLRKAVARDAFRRSLTLDRR